jgi:iron complex transport system ATP-binding protein
VNNGLVTEPISADVDLVVAMEKVSVRRGRTTLVRGIDWRVELDERWVVLGPNGAGKTTLLRLAGAEMHPTTGTVHVLGEKLGRTDVFELRTRIGICSAALAGRVPPEEKVLDVVVSAGYGVIGRWREQYDTTDTGRAEELLAALGIKHLSDRMFGTLSEGERKRALISRALMTDPEMLLLDEPAAGLDDTEADEVAALIRHLADEWGIAVLLVEHKVDLILSVSDRITVLDGGSILASGTPEEIRNDPAVIDAYLGVIAAPA